MEKNKIPNEHSGVVEKFLKFVDQVKEAKEKFDDAKGKLEDI